MAAILLLHPRRMRVQEISDVRPDLHGDVYARKRRVPGVERHPSRRRSTLAGCDGVEGFVGVRHAMQEVFEVALEAFVHLHVRE